MRQLPAERLTSDAFIDWAMHQPSGRFELVAGEVVAMAPERAGHALVELAAAGALKQAIAAAGVACEVYPDGMSVVVDAATVYEPDGLVRCGAPLNRDAGEVSDPLAIVEVLSLGTRTVDLGGKLEGYFRIASVRHHSSSTRRRGPSSITGVTTTACTRRSPPAAASCASTRPG